MFLIWQVHLISPCPKDGIMVKIPIDHLLHCDKYASAVWLYETFMGAKRLLSE